jgi:hypothetical protein
MATGTAAQDCVQNLETAQQRFDEGRIQDIEGLLKTCVAMGTYTDAEKSQALRLLTLAFIFLEEDVDAQYNMLMLLKANHEFEINPAVDPTEFINLHKRYRTKPLFNIGARYIFNFTQPVVTDLNGSLDLNNNIATRGTYTTVFSFLGLGLNFEYALNDKFILFPELQFITKTINKKIEQRELTSTNTTDAPYLIVENQENQQWLSLPVSVKYLFDVSKLFKLYAVAGGSIDYLIAASKPGDIATLQMTGAADVGFTIEKQNDHNRLNFGILAGGGATYKLGEGFIAFDARYAYGLTKVSLPENSLTSQDARQLGNVLIQDDGYRLNNIYLSVGYTANIYFPKKLR